MGHTSEFELVGKLELEPTLKLGALSYGNS
jgi:hypothetical protein